MNHKSLTVWEYSHGQRRLSFPDLAYVLEVGIAFESLNPRHVRFLKALLRHKNIRVASNKIGVSRERGRQILARAFNLANRRIRVFNNENDIGIIRSASSAQSVVKKSPSLR